MGGKFKDRRVLLIKLKSRADFGRAGQGRPTMIPDKKKESKKKKCRKPVKLDS